MKNILLLFFTCVFFADSAQISQRCLVCPADTSGVPNGDVLTKQNGYLNWTAGGGGAGPYWNLTGNSGTTPSVNYIGTSDNADLNIAAHGLQNMLLGNRTITADNVYKTEFTDAAGYGIIYDSSQNTLEIGVALPNGGAGIFFGGNTLGQPNIIAAAMGSRTNGEFGLTGMGYKNLSPYFDSTIITWFATIQDSTGASTANFYQVGVLRFQTEGADGSGGIFYIHFDTVRVECVYPTTQYQSGMISTPTSGVSFFINQPEGAPVPSLSIKPTGQLYYPYGTIANGDVLTTDASGNATWNNLGVSMTAWATTLGKYANDAAAAVGGVSVGGFYINSVTGAITQRQS